MNDLETIESIIKENNVTIQKETIKSGDILIFKTDEIINNRQYQAISKHLKKLTTKFDKNGIKNVTALFLDGGISVDCVLRKKDE